MTAILCHSFSFRLNLGLSSHLVVKHCAGVHLLLAACVKTPFFKYSNQNLGIVPMPGYKISTLYSGSKTYLGLGLPSV